MLIRYLQKPIFVEEHGSWAMLFVPFVSSLIALHSISFAILSLFIAILFFFFSYRPFELYLAYRAHPNKKEQKEHALTWIVLYLSIGSAFGIGTVLSTRAFIILPFGIAALILFIAGQLVSRLYRLQFLRDVLSIIAITLISPVSYLFIFPQITTLFYLLWFCNLAFFLSSGFYVHMKMSKQKKNDFATVKRSRLYNLLFQLGMLIILSILKTVNFLSWLQLIFLVPIFIHSIAGSFIFPSKPSFKKVGLIFTLYSLLFLVAFSVK